MISCGGGGGGGATIGGPAPDPLPPPSPSEPRLFFTGNLFAVDPASPSSPQQIETVPVSGATEILHSTWDAANKRLTDIHPRTVVYGKADGKLYQVGSLKSDPFTPSQISNETGAFPLCDTEDAWISDSSDHNRSVYFYTLPGPDNHCANSANDNIQKMVRLGMSATDSPIIISPKKMVADLADKSTGGIIGWLATDGSTLVRCNQDFQDCAPLISFNTTAEEVNADPFIGVSILQIDDTLRSYNIATGILSPPLHTLLTASALESTYISDATNAYFSDGGTIIKLSLDGTAGATPFVPEGGIIQDLNLTANRVIYTIAQANAFPFSLKSIDKNGTDVRTLVPATNDSIFLSFFTVGRLIYYTRGDGMATTTSALRTAGVVSEEGSGGSELPNADWMGFSLSSTFTQAGGLELLKVMRVEGCSATVAGCGGGTLKSFDAATQSGEVVLGTLPSDITSISFVGFGEDLLGEGVGRPASPPIDIFYVKAGKTQSLARVTETPSDETVVNFLSGSSR